MTGIMNSILPFAGFVVGSFAVVYGAIPIIFRKEIAEDERIRSLRPTFPTVELPRTQQWTRAMGAFSLASLTQTEPRNVISVGVLNGFRVNLDVLPAHTTSVMVVHS